MSPDVSSVMSYENKWLADLRLKTDDTDEALDDDKGSWIVQPIVSDDEASVLPGLTSQSWDSESPEESNRNKLENYQDEVQGIKDAISDSSWYSDDEEEQANDEKYNRGDYIVYGF